MNKKEKIMLNNYNNATMWSIDELYKTCSYAKHNAERYILNEMQSNNGYGYKVIGGNTFTFTCGYCYDKDNKSYLVYHTAYNKYVIDITNE